MYSDKIKKSFWEKVEVGTGCWEWTASLTGNGYGKFWNGNKLMMAYRVAWELSYGEIPEGLCVCHKCDNPKCVRADHLFLGTQSDNMKDCHRKGRGFVPPDNVKVRGEACSQSILTDETVLEMREMRKQGWKYREICEKINMSYCHVWNVCNGKAWKHIA